LIQKFVSKLSEQEKKFFYITVFVVFFAFLDRLFLGPVLGKIKNINEEISRQETSIVRDLRFLSYKDKISEESDMFSKYFAESMKDDDDINAEFLRIVENIATRSNVSLIKSNPSRTAKKKNYVEYYANLDCSGKLEDMISFMHAINTTDDLLKIVKLNITQKRGSEDEINASMTIEKMVITPEVRVE